MVRKLNLKHELIAEQYYENMSLSLRMLSISFLSGLIGWTQIRLIGHGLNPEQMSIFLAFWGIYSALALFIFIVQDVVEVKFGSSMKCGCLTHQKLNAKNQLLNFTNMTIITFTVSILAVFIGGRASLTLLCVIAAISQLPANKLIITDRGPRALNEFFMINGLLRFAIIFPFIGRINSSREILQILLMITIVLNLFFIRKYKNRLDKLCISELRVEPYFCLKWGFFWVMFYSDVILARLFMSSEEASTYSLISMVIKSIFIFQILPLKHAILQLQNTEISQNQNNDKWKALTPFLILWTVLGASLVLFQSEIVSLFIPYEIHLEKAVTFQLFVTQSAFVPVYIILELQKEKQYSFIAKSSILAMALTFLGYLLKTNIYWFLSIVLIIQSRFLWFFMKKIQ